jgi:phage terminase small subunit
MVKENLWLRCAKDAEKQLVAILDRLGLTPANRSKIKPAEGPKEAKPSATDEAMLSREAPAPVEEEIDLNKIDLTLVN